MDLGLCWCQRRPPHEEHIHFDLSLKSATRHESSGSPHAWDLRHRGAAQAPCLATGRTTWVATRRRLLSSPPPAANETVCVHGVDGGGGRTMTVRVVEPSIQLLWGGSVECEVTMQRDFVLPSCCSQVRDHSLFRFFLLFYDV